MVQRCRWRKQLLILCGIAIACGPLPAADLPALKEIPLLDCSGIPCIDLATASGKTLRLLIDTASNNSYLNPAAAANLGLEVKPLIAGNGQPIDEVRQTIVPGAKLGETPMGDFPFMVIAPDDAPQPSGKKAQPLPGDGAFAYSAFRNRILQLDFKNRVLRISEPLTEDPDCTPNCGNLRLEHFGNFGPATLTTGGFSVNGQPIKAQIDTCFTGTMLIYPPAVKKLDLGKQSKSHHKIEFPFTGGGVKLAEGEAETENFGSLPLLQNGPLYFVTNELQDTPGDKVDATVGAALFIHSTVTLDFKSWKMRVEN